MSGDVCTKTLVLADGLADLVAGPTAFSTLRRATSCRNTTPVPLGHEHAGGDALAPRSRSGSTAICESLPVKGRTVQSSLTWKP